MMNRKQSDSSRIPAFDQLGEEFTRVACLADQRSHTRWRRLGMSFLAVSIAVPAALALAQLDGSDEGGTVAVPDRALSLDPVKPPPGSDSAEGINSIGASVPEIAADRCRADRGALPDCGLILAIARGEIAPGVYSDEELREALRAAGYSDDF